MKNIIINVDNRTRKARLNTDILGVVGENLQGQFIIDFEGEFIQGACFLLCQMPNGESSYIAMTQDTKKSIYTSPIKSSLLTAEGDIRFQVKITEHSVDDEVPIFKSQIFNMSVGGEIDAETVTPDVYPDWEAVANAKLAEVDKALAELTQSKGRLFIKSFTISDFKQVGNSQRYVMAITKAEHGLANPYVDKMLINGAIDEEEATTYETAVVVGERTLSTGTIKVYVTIDLSQYTAYSGRIYIKGE